MLIAPRRKTEHKEKNKKGVISIILFFLVLFTILIVGFIAAVVVGIIGYGTDTITPIIADLGVVGDSNMSEYSGYTFSKLQTVIDFLPELVGFSYVLALMATIMFAMSIRYSPHPVFIVFYFSLMILLVFGAMWISNMYEDLYEDGDLIGQSLQEQTLLSYMILFSPFIMALMAVIGGIFMFVQPAEIGGGGFGV